MSGYGRLSFTGLKANIDIKDPQGAELSRHDSRVQPSSAGFGFDLLSSTTSKPMGELS
jgi:hypothetical protein